MSKETNKCCEQGQSIGFDFYRSDDYGHDRCKDSGVFAPVCCPGVFRVPRGRNIVEIVRGKGIIASVEEPHEPENGEEEVEIPEEEDKEAEFSFSIYKEHGKTYGEICIVDYEGKVKIQSKKLECFHSDYTSKLVAIFHLDSEEEGSSRELTVYARAKVCNLLPKFYAYSAPLCGEEILIGGDVVQGDIEFLKEKSGDSH